MQSLSINHPQIKASLENIYLTTKEASCVLGCSKEKVLFYTKAPKDVLRRRGEGKVLVNAFDVYNAVSKDSTDRLKFLSRVKNYLFSVSDYVYEEILSRIDDDEGEMEFTLEEWVGKDLINIEVNGSWEIEGRTTQTDYDSEPEWECIYCSISFDCKTQLYDEENDDWVDIANDFNNNELKSTILNNR